MFCKARRARARVEKSILSWRVVGAADCISDSGFRGGTSDTVKVTKAKPRERPE